MSRLLSEAVDAHNLRRSPQEAAADPVTTDWAKLYALVLAFCRHNLSDYDAVCTPQTRDDLRQQIHASIYQAYPWLRPEPDPRIDQGPAPNKQPYRVLNDLSADLAALISRRAQILMRISELKRKKPADGKTRVKKLKTELLELDENIKLKRGVFRTVGQIIGDKCPPKKRNCRIIGWHHKEPGYVFGCRMDLPPNYTESAGIKCPGCGRTVLRTKREMDLGAEIRLVCLSCYCQSIAVDKLYSWPSQAFWAA
jgi:hypothetical protein